MNLVVLERMLGRILCTSVVHADEIICQKIVDVDEQRASQVLCCLVSSLPFEAVRKVRLYLASVLTHKLG